MSDLSSPLTVLRGVGPALAKVLAKLDLHRVEDLLFLLPLRYEDRTTLHKIGSLQPGLRGLTCGEVLLAETVYRGRRSLLVRIGDGTGQLTLRFFYFSRQQQAQFQPGVTEMQFPRPSPRPNPSPGSVVALPASRCYLTWGISSSSFLNQFLSR